MARENGIDDLGYDSVVVADDAGENQTTGAHPHDQVVAHLVFDMAETQALLGKLVAAAKLGQSLRKIAQGLDTSRVTAALFLRPSETVANVRILRLPRSRAWVMELTSPVVVTEAVLIRGKRRVRRCENRKAGVRGLG